MTVQLNARSIFSPSNATCDSMPYVKCAYMHTCINASCPARRTSTPPQSPFSANELGAAVTRALLFHVQRRKKRDDALFVAKNVPKN